jgi:dephospho-CoA kinase
VAERRLLRVALTGGIATGKSHCLTHFAQLGVPVVDADELARGAVNPGSAALAAVASRFGSSLIGPDGRLDRSALARIVFTDPHARKDLEAIIHPFVYRAIDDWFARLAQRDLPDAGFALADIPLLYETGREVEFDRVVVTTCTAEQQVERLRRRGLTETEARQRIGSQSPLADKVARADYVIDTSRSVAETNRRVEDVSKDLATLADLSAVKPRH